MCLLIVGALGCSPNPPVKASIETGPEPSGHEFFDPRQASFISVEELVLARSRSEVIVVDVRAPTERAEAHIPDDIWVPLADLLETGTSTLEPYARSLIVLYCACPNAEAAFASVHLRDRGFDVARLRVLREGLPGWANAGLPLIKDSAPCAEERWPLACASEIEIRSP
jgi:rhodanese-related sulfurtransferase